MLMCCPSPESGPGVNEGAVVIQLRKDSVWRWKCDVIVGERKAESRREVPKEVAGDALAERAIRIWISIIATSRVSLTKQRVELQTLNNSPPRSIRSAHVCLAVESYGCNRRCS
jgi:hypothetical protein